MISFVPSSSVMPPVPWPAAGEIVALVELDILTKNVSQIASFTVSPLTWTVIGLLVSPGLKVKVPLVTT